MFYARFEAAVFPLPFRILLFALLKSFERAACTGFAAACIARPEKF